MINYNKFENGTTSIETATNALAFFMRAKTRDERIELVGEYLWCLNMRQVRQYVDGERTIEFYMENTISGNGCLTLKTELIAPTDNDKSLMDRILSFN